MHHNFEKDEVSNNQTISKGKTLANSLLPLTVKQINHLISKKDTPHLGRIVVVGRIIELKEMNNRTQVKLTDETGVITIIEGQDSSQL